MTAVETERLPRRADVVVVGAGLAGLATAHHLGAAGLDVCVVESADDVGGRVRSDVVEGFILDRGFQLYNPAYPEGQRVLDHAALELQPFTAGALIALGSRHYRVGDPRRVPTWAWNTVTAPLGSVASEARFATYAVNRALTSPATIESAPDITTEDALRQAGVDERMIERFLRPFLSGVFLESNLDTSRRFADFVLRSFIRGTPSVPAHGMAAIPRQLAARLPAPVHVNTTVTQVDRTSADRTSADRTQVRTSRGRIKAQAVIIATDPSTAGVLSSSISPPHGRSVTTWYWRADVPGSSLTDGRGVLALDGMASGPLVNAVVMSNAAPGYAPPGETLVSCSALGVHTDPDGALDARAHLGRILGTNTQRWELLATYPIPYALPAMAVPFTLRRPVRLGEGLYVAGDHRDTSSIQGALVSGRRAASAVIGDLRGALPDFEGITPTEGDA